MNYGEPLEIDIQGKRLSSTFRNLILAIKLAISVKDKAKQNRSEAKTRLRQPHSE